VSFSRLFVSLVNPTLKSLVLGKKADIGDRSCWRGNFGRVLLRFQRILVQRIFHLAWRSCSLVHGHSIQSNNQSLQPYDSCSANGKKFRPPLLTVGLCLNSPSFWLIWSQLFDFSEQCRYFMGDFGSLKCFLGFQPWHPDQIATAANSKDVVPLSTVT